MKNYQWPILHRMGMSDSSGEALVTWNQGCDTTSSISIRKSGVPGSDYKEVACTVSTIDAEMLKGLPAPTFLKIDTEGHDAAILRGGKSLLAGPKAPAMIQF